MKSLRILSKEQLNTVTKERESGIVSDQLNPSTEKNYHWISFKNPLFKGEINEFNDGGGWMIFIPHQKVDQAWEIIKKNTKENKLGYSCIASTDKSEGFFYKKGSKVIIVSNERCDDLDEIIRIKRKLIELGFDWPLCYKTDISSEKGNCGCGSHLFCKVVGWEELDNEYNKNLCSKILEERDELFTGIDKKSIERLEFTNNSLSDLNLKGFENLREIEGTKSKLANFSWIETLPHYETLRTLYIGNNSNLTGNLKELSVLINLTELDISGGLLRVNNITGSLAHLAKLARLRFLNISKTKVEGDIENLPQNLEVIRASGIKNIEDKLKAFKRFSLIGYDYQAWIEQQNI